MSAFTSEQARARFDEALDGELAEQEQKAFSEALARDQELNDEFERLRALQQATAQLGAAAPVDLLAGVQHKLRARSGGKFYRDRFSQRAGRGDALRVLIVLSVVLILGTLLWFAYDAGLLGSLHA